MRKRALQTTGIATQVSLLVQRPKALRFVEIVSVASERRPRPSKASVSRWCPRWATRPRKVFGHNAGLDEQ